VSRSPYSPPETPVADPPPAGATRGRRPPAVSVALLLLILILCNQFVRLASGLHSLVFASVFWIVVLIGLLFLIERGVGWARWVMLILTVVSSIQLAALLLAPTPAGLKLLPGVAYAVRSVIAEICLIAATILVFGPGRAWFAVRES
jgi:hypothetical protein